MTNEEVIEFLHRMKKNAEEEKKTYEDMLIPHALGMVVEVCNLSIKALEKQIPKKPLVDRIKVTSSAYDYQYSCPVCEVPISYGECCNNNKCRQCIDWGEDNE